MMAPRVTFANGEDASGMAMMLGGLLEENLRDYPGRARVTSLARGDVVLTASDRDVSVTLSLKGNEVVIANGKTEGASVLAGPWLEMAKLCSGQANPFTAVARRELTIKFGGRLDAMAAAGYALSIPSSFYDDDDERAAASQRLRRIAIAVGGATVTVVVVGYVRRRRRRSAERMC